MVFCIVFTNRRAFTNWFGYSFSSGLANNARSFTVPVVVSIWLSKVPKVPVANNCTLARS